MKTSVSSTLIAVATLLCPISPHAQLDPGEHPGAMQPTEPSDGEINPLEPDHKLHQARFPAKANAQTLP